MSKNIELDAPNISEVEYRYLRETLDSGYVSTAGPFVGRFESEFAGYVGSGRAVSTQSGTAALHIALHELGVGKGDEVIVPALTFVATVNPVVYVGASPVFADIDEKTWNISPDSIRKTITKRTKAVIPVHLYGNPCDMEGIMAIAKEHGLFVIEDATESLGSKYKGKHTGTFGDLGCFSFNGNKTITTGGGGMVCGDDEKRMEHIKFLVNQARDEGNGYYHPEVGFNFRMTNIEAALGLAQKERLEGFLFKKRKFNEIYRKILQDTNKVVFQEEYKQAESSCWLTCIKIDESIDICVLQKALSEAGIPTRRIFMPVTDFPPYKDKGKGPFINSREVYERGLCLPGSTLNDEEDIVYIAETLKNILGKS